MALITSISLGIAEKLRDKGYRHRFFARMAKDEVASGLREMRDQRALRQADLAQLAGMKQSAVSRIEQSDYAGWTFNTLLRVAEALDARLRVTFEPMEEVIRQYEQWETDQNVRATREQFVPHPQSAFRAATSVGLENQLRPDVTANRLLQQLLIPVRSVPVQPFVKQEVVLE